MANYLKISTIGSRHQTVTTAIDHYKIVELMLSHWQKKFAQVLPDKPDLIVVPEACDMPGGVVFSREKLFDYYRIRGNQLRDLFIKTARQNNCYIVYSAIREDENNNWFNSSILIDRNGEIVGIYNKNHVTIGEKEEMGILYGKEPFVANCDFGSVGFAICFDLNFNQLRLQYEKTKPDLILFSSMYHGGLMQTYWTYSCRCHFVGAISELPCEIRNPLGQVIATSTNYTDFVTAAVNLDCCLVHLGGGASENNREQILKLKTKYGPQVTIKDPGLLGSVLISSEHKKITAKQMAEEFEIELLDGYLLRCFKHRQKGIKES